LNSAHAELNLEVKRSKKEEEDLFNFTNFSSYISIPQVRIGVNFVALAVINN